MADAIAAQQQLQASIASDIQARVNEHQARIARLKAGQANLEAVGAPKPTQQLVMLAHGDSWFNYPLIGNGPLVSDTDIIVQLKTMGDIRPLILNLSHHGDATTTEMSLPKQERMIKELKNPANWMDSGKPDAILFSGGGNDIVGEQFCIYLDYAAKGKTGLDSSRFQKVLAAVGARYEDLFAFRNRYAPDVPIFGHCYDFPIPNGVHPMCAGPWLQPSLDYCGWTDLTKGTAIIRKALLEFKSLLTKLAAKPSNNFVLVPTQGVLAAADWANELHPYPEGFNKLARKFAVSLRSKFRGRI